MSRSLSSLLVPNLEDHCSKLVGDGDVSARSGSKPAFSVKHCIDGRALTALSYFLLMWRNAVQLSNPYDPTIQQIVSTFDKVAARLGNSLSEDAVLVCQLVYECIRRPEHGPPTSFSLDLLLHCKVVCIHLQTEVIQCSCRS